MEVKGGWDNEQVGHRAGHKAATDRKLGFCGATKKAESSARLAGIGAACTGDRDLSVMHGSGKQGPGASLSSMGGYAD